MAHQAVAIVRVHGLADFDEGVRRLADNSQKPADLRVAAAVAVAPRLPKMEGPLFEFLKAQSRRGRCRRWHAWRRRPPWATRV